MNDSNVMYSCPDCGHETDEVVSKCPACGRWHEDDLEANASEANGILIPPGGSQVSTPVTEMPKVEVSHIQTGIGEFDSVVGGGIFRGSAVFLSGSPGIGKSSLAMILAGKIAETEGHVVYLTTEETGVQAAERAQRIGAMHSRLCILSNDLIENAIAEAARLEAALVVVDSLQGTRTSYVTSHAGSPLQVREVASRIVEVAKTTGVPYLVTGQVVKSGRFAGPMAVSHVFDACLSIDEFTLPGFLLLRSNKNRFGSTEIVGSFRMTAKGVVEALHPSKELLVDGASGVISVSLEGTKPIAAMVQVVFTARTDSTSITLGYPKNRLSLIHLACRTDLGMDIPRSAAVNVLGGYKITDPTSDLSVAIATCFANEDLPCPVGWGAIGELDLSGRILPARDLLHRLSELVALEVSHVVIPFQGSETVVNVPMFSKMNIVRAKSVRDAVSALGFFEELKKRRLEKKANPVAIAVEPGASGVDPNAVVLKQRRGARRHPHGEKRRRDQARVVPHPRGAALAQQMPKPIQITRTKSDPPPPNEAPL